MLRRRGTVCTCHELEVSTHHCSMRDGMLVIDRDFEV